MAVNRKYNIALLQAQMAAVVTAVGNAALLRIYDGSQPADPSVAISGQTLCRELVCGTPFAPASSAARPSVLTVNDPTTNSNATGGTPTWWRVCAAGTGAGAAGIIDGNCAQSGTPGTDADMICGVITSGQPVDVTGWTITSGT